jgi:hypothetical protein
MGRRGVRRWTPEETGLELVESSERAHAFEDPVDCPACGGPLAEIRTIHETMPVGDGHTYTDVASLKGHCANCGWLRL